MLKQLPKLSDKMFRGAFVALTVLAFNAGTQAQSYSIADGSINTCAGVMNDNGGPGGDYTNNENFTVVICPDNPGDGISLFWSVFTLSTAGTNANMDRIRIWDGDNTGANFLGEYTGTQLQGLITSSTTFNPTGCLTIQFLSNGSGVGNFAAGITCYTPCEHPMAVAVMSEAVPARICQGEEVSFDGSGSYAAAGFNIVSYEWVFDDGTTGSGPTTSHIFDIPGEYVVQLNLLDDNNCVNSNVVDLQVLVSTTPSFNGTTESYSVCLGAGVDLEAVATPVTWTGLPEANFGDGVYLPDDLGSPFSSSVTFTQFNAGQLLTNANDLLSICVSMEHSFMGDLVLSVTCPNGQVIILHQQGGGGTFIGDANDTDGNANPVPGTCWTYCWAPNAVNGTFSECSQFGVTPNVVPSSQGTALAPGTYSTVQPWTNLQGCPLNGTWTYTSVDNWAADNGFICNWELNFNPAIIPPVTQFTPDLGTATLDSAYWMGQNLTNDPNNALLASAILDTPGSYPYQFFVTDNFGCMYDTTIFVTVQQPIALDAGPNIQLCSDPVPMAAQVVANPPPTPCQWTLTLNDGNSDAWNGANVELIIDGVSSNYSILFWGTPQQVFNIPVISGQTLEIQYTQSAWDNADVSFVLADDQGGVVYQSQMGPAAGVLYQGQATCPGTPPSVTWEWSPSAGLVDATDPTTDVFVTQATWYHLNVYPIGFPECAVNDSVMVAPDPSIDAGLSYTMTICQGEPVFLMTDSLGGTPDAGGVWTASDGTVIGNSFDPLTGTTDIYTYTVTSLNGCQATADLDITVIPADDPSCCGIADAGTPQISCNLTNTLSATPGNTGVGQWSGPAGAVFGNASDPLTTVTVQPGMGGSHMFYWIEDDGAFCYLIDSVLMTFTDTILVTTTHTDATCYTYCDGNAQAQVTGGNAVNGFTFDWSNGTYGLGLDHIQDLCTDTFNVVVTDDNGCIGTKSVFIDEPILLEIDSLATQPVTCSGDCDGQVEIYDPQAVEYSYDDGLSFVPSNLLPQACEAIYSVRIHDAAGCIGTGQIEVTGPPPVIPDFTWNPIPANVDDPRIWFGNLSTGAQTYWWDIAGLTTSTDPNPYFRFSEKEPGEYQVCLAAFNYNQCTDTICKTVIIDDVLFYYIPTSFTPDGDNLNETWGMSTNIDIITSFDLKVFDRWGGLVFQSDDPRKFWNGAADNSGAILMTGVYAYRVSFEIKKTEVRKEFMGHVTLIK